MADILVVEDESILAIELRRFLEAVGHEVRVAGRADGAVAAGRFRADLLHRLCVLTFEIPPLRERPEDLVRLARHFAEQLGRQYCRGPVRLEPDAEAAPCDYPWPGNVRELRNVIERAVLLSDGTALGAAALRRLGLATPAAEPSATSRHRIREIETALAA